MNMMIIKLIGLFLVLWLMYELFRWHRKTKNLHSLNEALRDIETQKAETELRDKLKQAKASLKTEPSADKEPSASKEPSAKKEPSANTTEDTTTADNREHK